MIDTTPITITIVRLIATGTTERELLVTVAQRFPEITRSEFFVAHQNATAAAEKPVARRH
jgi:hypothetical protein